MQILLCDNLTPEGAAHERVLAGLEEACAALRHATERVLFPFSPDGTRHAEQLIAMRLMSVADRADAMICLSPPTHLLNHPNKLIWLCGEPETLQLRRTSPDWLRSALSKGYAEARFLAVAEMRIHIQLESMGMVTQYLAPPLSSSPTAPHEWKTLVEKLLGNVRNGGR